MPRGKSAAIQLQAILHAIVSLAAEIAGQPRLGVAVEIVKTVVPCRCKRWTSLQPSSQVSMRLS